MAYGYTFLRSEPLNEDDPNRKIATCDLAGIRRFICPKTGGDPMKCLDCGGIKTCTPGQRAAVLLDEATRQKPQYNQVWTKEQSKLEHEKELEAARAKKKAEKAAGNFQPYVTQKDRDEFREACESGSPWIYLFARGYSEAAAQERISFWVRHYTNVAQEFGGKKRLLQKPRKIPPLPVPEEPTIPEEPEVTVPSEVIEVTEPKTKGRELCIEALSHSDPIAWMMETRGVTLKAAKQRLRDWRTRYADLFPEEEPGRAVEDSSDMVSLEDFLSEFGFEEPIPEKIPEQKEEPEDNINRELAELMEQEARLLREIAGLQEQVWSIREKRKAIEGKMSH